MKKPTDVYKKALKRFNEGKETFTDEVVIALWEEVSGQAETIRKLTRKVSILEARCGLTVEASPEYALLMQKLALQREAPLV